MGSLHTCRHVHTCARAAMRNTPSDLHCRRGSLGGTAATQRGKEELLAPLQVTYTCRDFGKVVRGRLFVSAGDMQYSYNLVGRMPTYVPPR